jgi:CSLREA domain-containing protein
MHLSIKTQFLRTALPVLTFLIVLLLPTFPVVAVEAPSFVVTSNADIVADDGVTTLREAIDYANSDPDANTITFADNVRGTIQFNADYSGTEPIFVPLTVNYSVNVKGPGSSALDLNAGIAQHRVHFVIGSQSASNRPSVNISGLTLSNGQSAIHATNCILTVDACVLSNNTGGPDIASKNSTLTVNACTFSGGSSPYPYLGDSIFIAGSQDDLATISFCTFNNHLEVDVFNANSTVYNMGATVVFNSCTFSEYGWNALYNEQGKVTLNSCTMQSNLYEDYNTRPYAILSSAGNVIVDSCTIIGGGISCGNYTFSEQGETTTLPSTLQIRNTILQVRGDQKSLMSDGIVTSLGHNLSSDAAGGHFRTTTPDGFLNGPGDIRNTDPLIGAFGDHGGPTHTYALLFDSPAINAGDTDFTTDQRGIARPQGLADDIGAFEVQEGISAPPPAVSITSPSNGKAVNSLASISGKAIDNSGTGIKRVELVLKRNIVQDYWTGAKWEARTILSTTVTGSTWKRDVNLPSGNDLVEGDYTIAASVFDNVGGTKSTSILFTIDKTLPSSLTIAAPVTGATLTALPSIKGTVADNSGGSGIGRIDVVLKRKKDNLYWTGTTWGARKLLSNVVSGSNWNVTATLPSGAQLMPGSYQVAAYAYDRAGNAIGANSNFAIAGTTPPSFKITRPASGQGVAVLTSLSGNVTDNSGTGIDRVEVVLKRNSDLLYWTGSSWGARTILNTTVSGTAWNRNSGLPTGEDLLEGQYTLGVTAFDNAGGSKSTSIFFYVDKTLPTSVTIASPVNGSSLTSLSSINGTATDNTGGSGIGKVTLVLKRNKDGLYWTGTAWGARKLLTTVVSGDRWNSTTSLPGSAHLLPGSYLVAAYAYDRANNAIAANSTFTFPGTALRAAPVSPQADTSLYTLSMATADDAQEAVRLTFTGPLEISSTVSVTNYTVTINGNPVNIENATLISNTTVMLGLPEESLGSRSRITVSYNLRDNKGRLLQATTQITVQ